MKEGGQTECPVHLRRRRSSTQLCGSDRSLALAAAARRGGDNEASLRDRRHPQRPTAAHRPQRTTADATEDTDGRSHRRQRRAPAGDGVQARHHGRVRRRVRRLQRGRRRRRDARNDQRGGGDVELADHRARRIHRRNVPVASRSTSSAIGCGDDTADRAIQEIRTLVEQDGANVVIGPLSGDEGIAIANYAKDHPEVTFIDGISGCTGGDAAGAGAELLPLHTVTVRSGTPVSATSCTTTAGWDTAAVIADDYGFGWTSAAGFIADFCAVGGDVVHAGVPAARTRPTTRRSSTVAESGRGRRLLLGRRRHRNPGLARSVRQRQGRPHGRAARRQPVLQPGAWRRRWGRTSPAPTSAASPRSPGDVKTPEITAYAASADAAWDTLAGAHDRQRARPALDGADASASPTATTWPARR